MERFALSSNCNPHLLTHWILQEVLRVEILVPNWGKGTVKLYCRAVEGPNGASVDCEKTACSRSVAEGSSLPPTPSQAADSSLSRA